MPFKPPRELLKVPSMSLYSLYIYIEILYIYILKSTNIVISAICHEIFEENLYIVNNYMSCNIYYRLYLKIVDSLILDIINPKMLPFLGEKKSPTERNKKFHISICIRIISKPKERWLQFCSQRGMSQMLPAAMEATRHISKMISLMKRHGFCLRLFKEKREVIEIPPISKRRTLHPKLF